MTPSSEVTFIPTSILGLVFVNVKTLYSPVPLGLTLDVVVMFVGFCSALASILGIFPTKVSYPWE